jgi:hypothetical protein
MFYPRSKFPLRLLVAHLLTCFAVGLARGETANVNVPGVKIDYQLPVTEPLPHSYRVTLAITDADDQNWIVSTFVSGAVRTVTTENQGKFTDVWNGLDDNFMPVPPGQYGIKGIFMPARPWPITGELHTFLPKLAVAAGDSWFPAPQDDKQVPWMVYAGFGTMADVAIGENGQAIFFHNYIENSFNPFVVDLNRPIGFSQILRAYPSGGTAGGVAVATDGEVVWEAIHDPPGGNMIVRADGKPFGSDQSRYIENVFKVSGRVTGLAALRDPDAGISFLYVARREAPTGLLVLDGKNGLLLKEIPITDIQAVAIRDGVIFILHKDDRARWLVSRAALEHGLPAESWRPYVYLDAIAKPTDFKLDSGGHVYVSDLSANQVYELDQRGSVVRRFGRADHQQPGHYDDHVFMSPGKLALWRDAKGQNRLFVIERSGPGRVSEWTTDGRLLRQWFPGAVEAVFGYAADPADPRHIYMATSEPASGRGLVRYRVDYKTGAWTVDAVWPDIASRDGCPGGSAYPKIINAHGSKFLAFARTHENSVNCDYMLYRLDGENWVPSAGLVPDDLNAGKESALSWWNDANGNGKIDEAEYRGRPANLPMAPSYWGETWLDDLSLVMLEPGGQRAWRIAPSGFDSHGNPIFDGATWKLILLDPTAEGAQVGSEPYMHYGRNEVLPTIGTAWKDIDGSPDSGFVVASTNGPRWPDGLDYTARIGSQVKLTRYLPDGHGGYRPVWRVGRKAFGLAAPGEMYSPLHVTRPIKGFIAIQDGNGMFYVYTDDGLYVDTLFYDVFRGTRQEGGVYTLNSELFNGYAFANKEDNNVYIAAGRNAATIFKIEGWDEKDRVVTPIASLSHQVTLTAADVAAIPPPALRLREGQHQASIIEITPSPGGGPTLDGSLNGWLNAAPISFGIDKDRQVEIRAMYDSETIYLHAHLRLGRAPQTAGESNFDRIFADAIGADTISFYIQGDPAAVTDAPARAGDARFVLALSKDTQGVIRPIIVGMYPISEGVTVMHPVTYSSPVGKASFADVKLVTNARLGYVLDGDNLGFTIAAAIPKSAIPLLPASQTGAIHTRVDFEATLAGKTKFWWSNTDGSASTTTSDVPSEAGLYPGAWSDAEFLPLGDSMQVHTWLVSGPWGGPGLPQPRFVGNGLAQYKVELLKFFEDTQYPPDNHQSDFHANYQGPLSENLSGTSQIIDWHVVRQQPGTNTVNLGDIGQLYFATAWIHAPSDRDVEIKFVSEPHNVIKAWLNDTQLPQQVVGNPPFQFATPVSRQQVHLRAGWNQLFLRAYAVGYSLALGVQIRDAPERLWELGLSASPP